MPYITQEARTPYRILIENTVKIICEEKDLTRAELAGFFVQRIVSGFLDHEFELNLKSFQDPDRLENLLKLANGFSEQVLKNSDLFSQAGELNYLVSTVLYGILGDSLYSGGPARYGFRVYLKGILQRISDQLDKSSSLRREIICQGVISDVVDEMYRRKTAIYENQKMRETGDLWPLRSISFVEKTVYEPRIRDENFDEIED